MVLINLYPISAGGGLQNALSFLTELQCAKINFNYFVIVRRDSILHEFCISKKLPCIYFNDGLIGRICFELFSFYMVVKSQNARIIFTLFGNPPLIRPKVTCISGFARSNIVESQVDFWGFLPIRKKVVKVFKDILILKLVRLSDVVILETQRLVRIAKYNNTFGSAKVYLVNMSPSALIINKLRSINELNSQVNINRFAEHSILYLAGSHPNKNVHRLAPFILELNRLGLIVKLVTTLPEGNYLNSVTKSFQELGIYNKINNVGVISPNDVPQIIEKCSALINVAELESFSNNWVEAWASKRLLICKDSGYSRESCGDSAIYLNFDNVQKAASEVFYALTDMKKFEVYITNGISKLNNLPSSNEKFNEYIKIIEKFL